jgi:predicted small integral membrane protein
MMEPLRLFQALFTGYIGLFAASVVLNNLTDYGTNYNFVRHVMSMDTIFPDCRLTWRRITSRVVHHAAYIFIILLEALTAVLCLWGAWAMWDARGFDTAGFQAAKSLGLWGLGLGFTVWFAIFVIGAGQWWAAWQSKDYSGQDATFRYYVAIGIVFAIVMQPS